MATALTAVPKSHPTKYEDGFTTDLYFEITDKPDGKKKMLHIRASQDFTEVQNAYFDGENGTRVQVPETYLERTEKKDGQLLFYELGANIF